MEKFPSYSGVDGGTWKEEHQILLLLFFLENIFLFIVCLFSNLLLKFILTSLGATYINVIFFSIFSLELSGSVLRVLD